MTGAGHRYPRLHTPAGDHAPWPATMRPCGRLPAVAGDYASSSLYSVSSQRRLSLIKSGIGNP